MGCCGRGVSPSGASFASGWPSAAPRVSAGPRRYSHVFFEYTGGTALTVVGRATGKRYRFERPGARVAVDPIDKPSIAGVSQLRIVHGP